MIPIDSALRDRAAEAFARVFSGSPQVFSTAPGRVNLIGEHTDYNEGFVLPVAIDRSTMVAAKSISGSNFRVVSDDFGETDEFCLADLPARSDKIWANYIRGIVAALVARGHRPGGAELAIAGDVPIGGGLSSSASLEIAVAQALLSLDGQRIDPIELARIGQEAESDFVGCPCGIMDQLTAVRARRGHALQIDCRSLDMRLAALPSDTAVVVVDSGVRHANNDGRYALRRRECEEAARHYGVASLRDLESAALPTVKDAPLLARRARHVVSENDRVLGAATALESGDLETLGHLMAESHLSMRDDFEISVPPIDRLVEIATACLDGQGGARMTGGGFGGSIVIICRPARVEALRTEIERSYRAQTDEPARLHVCQASDGVEPLLAPNPL